MNPGTQIIYVPTHANGNPDHPDCEQGFVTSVRNNMAFCRFWSKDDPGQLRTKSNSEATPIGLIIEQDTRPQAVVNQTLELLV